MLNIDWPEVSAATEAAIAAIGLATAVLFALWLAATSGGQIRQRTRRAWRSVQDRREQRVEVRTARREAHNYGRRYGPQ